MLGDLRAGSSSRSLKYSSCTNLEFTGSQGSLTAGSLSWYLPKNISQQLCWECMCIAGSSLTLSSSTPWVGDIPFWPDARLGDWEDSPGKCIKGHSPGQKWNPTLHSHQTSMTSTDPRNFCSLPSCVLWVVQNSFCLFQLQGQHYCWNSHEILGGSQRLEWKAPFSSASPAHMASSALIPNKLLPGALHSWGQWVL